MRLQTSTTDFSSRQVLEHLELREYDLLNADKINSESLSHLMIISSTFHDPFYERLCVPICTLNLGSRCTEMALQRGLPWLTACHQWCRHLSELTNGVVAFALKQMIPAVMLACVSCPTVFVTTPCTLVREPHAQEHPSQTWVTTLSCPTL